MADEVRVTNVGQSREEIAYQLYRDVLGAEDNHSWDREYLLSTYAECLQAVAYPGDRHKRR